MHDLFLRLGVALMADGVGERFAITSAFSTIARTSGPRVSFSARSSSSSRI
jgi:hypothetical protein